MTYCPECGSEVEPENTFCAYCGIALTPVAPIAQSQPSTAADTSASDNEEKIAPANQPPVMDSQVSVSATEDEKAEELPPTLTAYDNPIPDFDWSLPNIEPKAETPRHPTADNIARNTDSSVAVPPFEAENPKVPEDIYFSEAPVVSEKPISNTEAGKELPPNDFPPQSFNDGKFEVENQSPAQKNFDENFVLEEAVSQSGEKSDFQQITPPNQAEMLNQFDDSDFQSTIPYSPRDYASHNLMADKIEESEPIQEIKPVTEANPPEDVSSKSTPPIEKPEVPVGSTAHDSLEPKLVSVQIYNPKEQPKEENQPEAVDSIYDSQTLLKPSLPVQEEPQKKSRAYTSPNMGGDDTDGRGKAKLKPLDEGTVLNGRYEIVRRIGGGGMGAVYLASDRNLGGVLRAVKEMVQSYIEDAQQEKAINDFKRESLLLTSLEHPAIPTIFDYFYDEKEGRFYLVMKYISGGDLAARLRSSPEGKLDEVTVTEWGIQIADVLDYLHNRQPPIVYRDLKPSNIMIDGNTGRIMLIDFGIARWVNKEEKGVTAVGTMGYAPPELFSGNVEPRSDIYSLGSTMFHLLTGADPQSNPLLIFDFHKNPRPRQINSTLSDQIEQILMKMVEYGAEKRYKSAAELRDALARHLEDLKKGAVTYGAGEVAVAPPIPGGLVFCGFCGQKIVATDVFCPFCGAQQPLASQAAKAAPAYVAPKLTAKLMVVSTSDLNAPMFNLEKDNNLVGRRDPMSNIFPEVDLSKFDPQTKISRRHARIWRESDKYMVEDLGSSNGTVLITKSNEMLRLIKNQPHVLSHGDKLRLGDTTLHFVLS
jgi:eukaryotic-like serine/threonine-protein kinase